MKTHRVCKRCNSKVVKETIVKGYPFYCPECDENLYRIETKNVKTLKSKHN